VTFIPGLPTLPGYAFHVDPPSVADDLPEDRIQASMLSRIRNVAPGVGAFAVPNAGKRSDWERVQRWKEGAHAGTSDLVLPWPKAVAFVEVKNRNGKLTTEQVAFLNRMSRMGHPAGCFRHADTLEVALRFWGAPMIRAAA